MAHIIAAEHVWLARLLQREAPFPVWPDLGIDRCEDEAKLLQPAWERYLSQGGAEALDARTSYKNSKGEAWNSLVRDVLTHVFLHSTYHRGQIAADMRAAGHEPAYTDFIHGVRQGCFEE
jgi:uncharacterized damage-inducible protein DinB